jgi:hypothetical protein
MNRHKKHHASVWSAQSDAPRLVCFSYDQDFPRCIKIDPRLHQVASLANRSLLSLQGGWHGTRSPGYIWVDYSSSEMMFPGSSLCYLFWFRCPPLLETWMMDRTRLFSPTAKTRKERWSGYLLPARSFGVSAANLGTLSHLDPRRDIHREEANRYSWLATANWPVRV